MNSPLVTFPEDAFLKITFNSIYISKINLQWIDLQVEVLYQMLQSRNVRHNDD